MFVYALKVYFNEIRDEFFKSADINRYVTLTIHAQIFKKICADLNQSADPVWKQLFI